MVGIVGKKKELSMINEQHVSMEAVPCELMEKDNSKMTTMK